MFYILRGGEVTPFDDPNRTPYGSLVAKFAGLTDAFN